MPNTIGTEIANISQALGTGTLGGYVKNAEGETCFISCWHVMKDSTTLAGPVDPGSTAIVNINSGNAVMGNVIAGALTATYDLGIALCTIPGFQPSNTIPGEGFAVQTQYRALVPFDEAVSTPVKIAGKNSQVIDAAIFNWQTGATLPYPDGNSYTLSDLFSLTNPGGSVAGAQPPTDEGDSGALVIDAATGAPLGLIVGAQDNFSFAIKFSNVSGPGQPLNGFTFII